MLKEAINNAIDEQMNGFGNVIEISIDNGKHVKVRDYGRGIPFENIDHILFEEDNDQWYNKNPYKCLGLTHFGLKTLGAYSDNLSISSFSNGQVKEIHLSRGCKIEESIRQSNEQSGLEIAFVLDAEVFDDYSFRDEFVKEIVHNAGYTNPTIQIVYNGRVYSHPEGMKDMLTSIVKWEDMLYAPIHITTELFEVAFTHTNSPDNEYYPFVNGLFTRPHFLPFRDSDTQISAFKNSLGRIIERYQDGASKYITHIAAV